MRKRRAISPYLFSGNSIRLRVKIFFLLILAVLISGTTVHFFDSVNSNNDLTKSYNEKRDYQIKYQQTQKDFNFLLSQFNNQLNCYQLQNNSDQSICATHNNSQIPNH